MHQKARTDLEFDAILALLRALTSTPLGAAQVETVRPAVEAEEVSHEQALTIEATQYLGAHGALPFGTFLALGAIVAAVAGDGILAWYLSFY